jgi:hypothetical protein
LKIIYPQPVNENVCCLLMIMVLLFNIHENCEIDAFINLSKWIKASHKIVTNKFHVVLY